MYSRQPTGTASASRNVRSLMFLYNRESRRDFFLSVMVHKEITLCRARWSTSPTCIDGYKDQLLCVSQCCGWLAAELNLLLYLEWYTALGRTDDERNGTIDSPKCRKRRKAAARRQSGNCRLVISKFNWSRRGGWSEESPSHTQWSDHHAAWNRCWRKSQVSITRADEKKKDERNTFKSTRTNARPLDLVDKRLVTRTLSSVHSFFLAANDRPKIFFDSAFNGHPPSSAYIPSENFSISPFFFLAQELARKV